jgi:hypothetical protein
LLCAAVYTILKFTLGMIIICVCVQTYIIFVGVVEGVDNGWVRGPLVLVHRLPQLLQVVVGVVSHQAENILEELGLCQVQLKIHVRSIFIFHTQPKHCFCQRIHALKSEKHFVAK